ncbi:MAG: hypothetical protein WBD36_11230 [Bacteroidota bacterium]
MADREKHTTLVFGDVRIDIKQMVSGSKIKDFAINVALIMDHELKDVFRVDTAQGYLHGQKFWISPDPEKLQDKRKKDYKGEIGSWKDNVVKNFKEYIRLYKKKFRAD